MVKSPEYDRNFQAAVDAWFALPEDERIETNLLLFAIGQMRERSYPQPAEALPAH